jgi:small subunit ribosomal protein S6
MISQRRTTAALSTLLRCPVLPAAAPTYDLVLLLDLSATDEERAKALADARTQIQGGGGEISHDQAWGERPLAYPIAHKEQAQYHLLQFHAPGPLVEALDRNLRIADGVLRHRIIKLAPGTPAAPEHGPRGAHHAAPAAPAETEPVAAAG